MPDRDIGYLLKNINDRMKARADAQLRRYRLTLAQGRVLAYLAERGGQTTQKEIERFLQVAHPTVVGLVSRLEQNGYVATWTDGTDRRNKIVATTARADAVGSDMGRNIRSNEARMLRSLSAEDVERLWQMLTVINRNLE